MRGVYEKVKGSRDFYIRYTENGKRHREHVGRESAAIEAPKNALTFKDLFDMRMADPEIDLKPKTSRHHEYEFNCARLESLKNMLARNISSQDIKTVLAGLREDGLSPGTIRNYRSLISAVFAFGIRQEYLDKNPVLKVRAPEPTKDRVRYLTEDDEKSMREKIRQHWPERLAELDLLLHTGMRSGEAYKLTWDRVDLDRGIIDVPTGGKTGWRPIPINSTCHAALEALHRQSQGSKFVIPRCGRWVDGKRVEDGENWIIGKWFGDAVEKAGVVNASPHILRHTFASRLVMAGVDIRTVQKFLGHSSIKMTERYAHLSPEHGKAAIEKLVAPAAAAPTSAAKRPVRIRTAAAEKVARIA